MACLQLWSRWSSSRHDSQDAGKEEVTTPRQENLPQCVRYCNINYLFRLLWRSCLQILYIHFSKNISVYAMVNVHNIIMILQSANYQCTPVKSSSSWPVAVLKHTEYFRLTRLWFTQFGGKKQTACLKQGSHCNFSPNRSGSQKREEGGGNMPCCCTYHITLGFEVCVSLTHIASIPVLHHSYRCLQYE